jgi:predicted RNase H-like nuclease
MSVTVAGVDGCRGGWLCVLRHADKPFGESARIFKTIGEIMQHLCAPAIVAIDIPIGLPERITGAGRDCDAAARAVLGKRAAAVFAVPARAAIAATSYREACAAAMAHSDPPRQVSQQMFGLFAKVREVDDCMTPDLQERVYECHPEAAFWAMNKGSPLLEPKKKSGRPHVPGLEQRRELLLSEGYCGRFLSETKFSASHAGPDDFLDACACAWTASRIFRGEAVRFPADPQSDSKGLRMEILA